MSTSAAAKFTNPRAKFNFQGRTCSISGVGSYVPARILTNAELEKMVDTTDDWITTRTGIKERRLAADDELVRGTAAAAAIAVGEADDDVERARLRRRAGEQTRGRKREARRQRADGREVAAADSAGLRELLAERRVDRARGVGRVSSVGRDTLRPSGKRTNVPGGPFPIIGSVEVRSCSRRRDVSARLVPQAQRRRRPPAALCRRSAS